MSLIVFAFAAALAGQDVAASRDCMDDNGVDHCDASNRADVLRTLGLAPIEDESAAGAEVYRILQIDGYGRVMPAIAFERRPGSGPKVVVYARDGRTMSATARIEDWRTVQSASRFADRELAPRPASSPEVSICLHAWIRTVEISNSAAARGAPEPGVRRRTESACDAAVTSQFADDVATMALAHFPECASLDPDEYRNDTTRLDFCARFTGDRLAAAGLMNQVGWRITPERDAGAARAWARTFGVNASVDLDWAGQRIRAGRGVTENPVAAFLAARSAETPSLRGYLSDFHGVSSTRVETVGRFDMEGPDDRIVSAPFRQVWVWDSYSLTWALQSWTVEPFAPAP